MYKVNYYSLALKDLLEIYNYIKNVIKEPVIAEKQFNRIRKKLNR